MSRILFALGSLEAGGAERVAVNLCNFWADSNEHEIYLVTGESKKKDFYSVSKRVNRISLGFKYNIKSFILIACENIRRFTLIRKLIGDVNPDLIILSTSDVAIRFMLNLIFYKGNVIVCEHNNYYALKSKIKRGLRLLTYKFATKLVLLTSRDINNYVTRGFNSKKIEVIENPLGLSGPEVIDYESKFSKKLLAVGRLCEQKAFDRMIKVMTILPDEYTLTIVGEGELKANLQKLIDENLLNSRVKLVGRSSSMEHIYSNHSVLVMTSIYEGLPMVINEANAFGLPVIAYNCPTGPAEMIDDSQTGFLVDDGNEILFAQKVIYITSDSKIYVKLSKSANIHSKEYSIHKICSRWRMLFSKILKE